MGAVFAAAAEEKDAFKPAYTKIAPKGSLEIRQLKPVTPPTSEAKGAAPFTIYTAVVLGETGSGKSTLLNALANFLYGVKAEDPFRYRLVNEEDVDQIHSKTKSVTSYYIPIPEFVIGEPNVWVKLVDTPGFGDTNGVLSDGDEANTAAIVGYLKQEVTIHAVCFISKANQNRLTPTQRYVVGKIMELFGKDSRKNIFLMATFADENEPQILPGLKEMDFPVEDYFSFNNAALFQPKEARKGFFKLYWEMYEVGAEAFLSRIRAIQPFSLAITKKVLDERRKVQLNIQNLQVNIRLALDTMAAIEVEEKKIDINRKVIDQNKDYKLRIPEQKWRKRDITGVYTTTCTICNYTCHNNCVYANNGDKKSCCAMTTRCGEDTAECGQCPKKCPWNVHQNLPYIIEYYTEIREENVQAKLDAYTGAKTQVSNSDAALAKLRTEYKKAEATVREAVDKVRENLEVLRKDGLIKFNYSFLDYLELLIESEESEKKPGYLERLKSLRKLHAEQKALLDIDKDAAAAAKLLPNGKK